jgi:hypothetical protein
MKKRLLHRFFVVGLVLIPFLFVEAALAQNNVTFQVRMNIKMREQSFVPGSNDIVRVAGAFNGWGGSTDTLTDPNNDSIYTKVVSVAAGATEYKFLKTLRGGIDWEGVANRAYTVVAGDQTIPPVYFDDDSIYTPPVAAPVTFRVNMRVKLIEGAFQPQNGDAVRVAGSINGWGSSTDTLVDVPPTDSVYQKTINVNEGQAIEYKFLKTLRGGGDWENVPNRALTVPPGGTTLPAPYFDGDSVVNVAINANIVWRVDMRAMQNIGWFAPGSNDSVQVRGGFEGWGGTRMVFDPVSQLYRVTAPYSGFSFDQIPHKFFMKVDSLSANTRFPGWATNQDGLQYDHPYERGDGNRSFDVQNGGNIVTPPFYFSSIHRYATLNNTTDTSRVTIRVNMGPAMRYIDPFNPVTDTVKLVFFDDMWYRAQIANQGAFSSEQIMAQQGVNDSVWVLSFKVKGKAHAGLLYYYRFIHPGGNAVNEGGGLGVSQPYRSRFIQPTGPNAFPATYATPVDNWQKDAPMPCETPIFGITDVANTDMGVPESYKLEQNYPNPFNPSTRISYAIPENAKVRLTIYNLLGQQVATLVNEDQQLGNHAVLFEANKLSTGVYFYRLEAGKFTQTRKMLLLK